jgi:hypothetical protein
MKTLERFWQWFDSEKPTVAAAGVKSSQNMSKPARDAVSYAAAFIYCRVHPDAHWGAADTRNWALEHHPGALRDLSLAMLPALEAMEGAVLEGKPIQWVKQTSNWYELGPMSPFQREYMGEWVTNTTDMIGARQAGKTQRIERMREMFETGKITTWHEAQVVNGVLTVVDKAKGTP